MVRAMRLGLRLGLTDAAYAARVERLLRAYGYRLTAPEVTPESLLAAMRADKKRSGNELRFVLQHDLERTELRAVAPQEVLAVLAD